MIWILSAMWFFVGVNVGLQIGASIYRRHLKASMKLNDEYHKLCQEMVDNIKDIEQKIKDSINSAVSPSETNLTK